LTETDQHLGASGAAGSRPSSTTSFIDRAAAFTVHLYQLMAVAAFMAAVLLAISWLSDPFPGALYDRELNFVRAAPTGEKAAWDLYKQGVQGGDHLVSLDGVPVQVTADVRRILQAFIPGESVPVAIHGVNGVDRTLQVKLASFPPGDRSLYVVLPGFVGLLCLAASLWIFGVRRQGSGGRAFAVLSASLSIVWNSLFDLFSTHVMTYAWMLGTAIGAAALIDLGLTFPTESRFLAHRRYLHWTGYLVAVGLLVYAFFANGAVDVLAGPPPAFRVICAFAAVGVLAFTLLGLLQAYWDRSPVIKAAGRTSLTAMVLSAGPLIGWFLLSPPHALTFSPLWFLPTIFLPLLLGYSIARGRSGFGPNWARQGGLYLALSVCIVGAYALVITGLGLIFRTAMPFDSPLWIGGLVLILALLLNPLRGHLHDLLGRTLFRDGRAHAATLDKLTEELARARDLAAVSGSLRESLRSALSPALIHIFVYDGFSEQFVALPDENNRPTTDIRFGLGGVLAQHLNRERFAFALDDKAFPPALRADRSRLAVLGARLLIPLPSRERLAGWLALGPRVSGEAYTPRDLELLQSIADRVSAVIQRVQDLADLERRVQQTNAIGRVLQGVNITLKFDDALELIYAQTSKMMRLSDFHITLYDVQRDTFHVGFAVENNERVLQRENQRVPANLGLAPEVVRGGRPIITQDYGQECRARGVSPASDGIVAWMGVPLNAGGTSIGAVSVASRDTATAYTSGHVALLQAVADQATGAIVKARLLQESQERARQLSQLNDIARRLTSTLELEPLLQSIVEGSISVLGCEACVLYLVDEPASELVIRATAGAMPRSVVGRRVPIGSGMGGRVAQTGAPILDNQVQPEAGDILHETESGFVTLASLAAPLQIQERCIGVLQVMNRRDGLLFADQEQTLLTALAGQAAVAMENVRLYMLTDQELAARVEELSVMQRIDRELNASLESERAMRITLEWALRQSSADAGLIGILEDSALRVVAHVGYGQALSGAADQSIALSQPGFQEAMDTGLPQQRDFADGGAGGMLPGSGHQTLIPIRREASVIGLLVLEGMGSPREDLAFLSRLSDHAAIAISNAQLYDELRRANAAKSEFVSLVAHELANPMTSIKGYAEMLAAGNVGPITEMQANFLHTIRSNTERMATLVSDLNDNSKIEAGQLRLDFRTVDLALLVGDILQSSKQQIDDKEQTVEVDLPSNLPRVWGDPIRVGQVLTNLISNANKYTPQGGILAIGAETSRNVWDPNGAGQVVHVWLRDNGIGISVGEEPRVFQKFFRSEDPEAREVPGVGLGLNITRSLVELQGGRIWFESQHGRGTTFHFTLPVAEA